MNPSSPRVPGQKSVLANIEQQYPLFSSSMHPSALSAIRKSIASIELISSIFMMSYMIEYSPSLIPHAQSRPIGHIYAKRNYVHRNCVQYSSFSQKYVQFLPPPVTLSPLYSLSLIFDGKSIRLAKRPKTGTFFCIPPDDGGDSYAAIIVTGFETVTNGDR